MQEADISYFVELGEHLWCLRLEERESEKRMGGARQDFQVLLRGKESQSLDLLQQVRLFSGSSGSSGSRSSGSNPSNLPLLISKSSGSSGSSGASPSSESSFSGSSSSSWKQQ